MLQKILFLVWYLTTVSGISLQISPPKVVLLSQSPPQTSFLCSGISAPAVARIYDIRLLMIDQYGSDKVFATAESGPVFQTDTAPANLKKPTAAVVSGGINSTRPTSSTLQVDFETNEMVCADAGMYKCSYTYKSTDNQIDTIEAQANLSVHALPSDLLLTAQKGGMDVMGTLDTPLEIDVNDTIQFTCNGKIGGEKSNLIRWKISSLFNNSFNLYQDNVNPGPTSATPVDCSYSSSSTLTYVIQDVDVNRENSLAFKCFVNDQLPNQGQENEESNVFYIKVRTNRIEQTTKVAPVTNKASVQKHVSGGLLLASLLLLGNYSK